VGATKKMTKVLIIGGLGFIGNYLAKECLKKKFEVTILSKTKNKIKNIEDIKNSVKLIIKDVAEIDLEVKGFDYIFDLAGSTDNYSIIENEPYKDIQMNCTGTIALLEACKKHNPRARIIYASTFFVNGQVKKLPVTSDSPCSPRGLYGATKLAAEHFCKIYANIFGLDIVIARFTNVFGELENGENKKKAGFNYLINLAVKGEEIPVYEGGDYYRDYIYVTDVVDACILLAEKGIRNKIYYVGRGEFIKFKELIEILINETQSTSISIPSPEFHKKVGIRDFVCDNTPLREIGWKPKISIKEGIINTIKHYKKELKKN